MGWRKKRRPPCNRADRGCDITPPVTVQTSAGSLVTRKFVEPLWEDKQMNADTACAASDQATGQKAINAYCEGLAISMAKPASGKGSLVEA